MEGIDLDYRKRETHLFLMLKERYLWDWAKLVFIITYLIWIIIFFASGYLGHEILPQGYEIWIPPVTVGTIIITTIIIWRQIVNINKFRYEYLPKARKIAEKHARIGANR